VRRIPRVKADRTVTHRIEFSPWEREQVELYLITASVKNIAYPACAGLIAVSVGLVGWGCYQWFKDAGFDDILKHTGVGLGATSRKTAPATWLILKNFFGSNDPDEEEGV
jgi:hypothetical protein